MKHLTSLPATLAAMLMLSGCDGQNQPAVTPEEAAAIQATAEAIETIDSFRSAERERQAAIDSSSVEYARDPDNHDFLAEVCASPVDRFSLAKECEEFDRVTAEDSVSTEGAEH